MNREYFSLREEYVGDLWWIIFLKKKCIFLKNEKLRDMIKKYHYHKIIEKKLINMTIIKN